MLKGILHILWKQQSAKDETAHSQQTHVIFSGYNEYSKILKKKRLDKVSICQLLSIFLKTHKIKKGIKRRCLVLQNNMPDIQYEYYIEYFTHKVKYVSK